MQFDVLVTVLCIFILLAIGKIWMVIRLSNSRIHELESTGIDQEKSIAKLSRLVCRSKVLEVLGEYPGDLNLNAQHGEELFLWELCGFGAQGYFVEIGAYNGISLSNSYFFEQIGWKGLLVEAHPKLVIECEERRPLSTVVHAALGEVDGGEVNFHKVRGNEGIDTLSFVNSDAQHIDRIRREGGTIEEIGVPARTLTSVLDDQECNEIDWISIDVEGLELAVLRGMDFEKYRPKAILIEANSSSAERAISGYLKQHSFALHMKIGCNLLFQSV